MFSWLESLLFGCQHRKLSSSFLCYSPKVDSEEMEYEIGIRCDDCGDFRVTMCYCPEFFELNSEVVILRAYRDRVITTLGTLLESQEVR